MIDFIAFAQDLRRCPAASYRSDAEVSNQCRPIYLWRRMLKTGQHPWTCSGRWTPQFDDLSENPWWSWSKLERFWLDANWMRGSIPSQIAEKWPNLRSLDLYDNELVGNLPPQLGLLTNLQKLQLHANQFSGIVPFRALFALPELTTLSVHDNAGLAGCISTADVLNATLDSLRVTQGTSIKIADRCD